MNLENSEQQFSPEQSLTIIQSMIETAKNEFSENGHLYLLWGWVVFICSIAEFILLAIFKYEHHYIVWMLTWVAFIYQIIYLVKEKRKKRRPLSCSSEGKGQKWI